MEVQQQIKRTLSRPENVELICQLLTDGREGLVRTALADQLCERFGFLDGQGNKQRSTCLKALRELERAGNFRLPPPLGKKAAERRKPMPRLSGQLPPVPQEVPATVNALQGLRLVLVEQEPQLLLWNDLMHEEHPRGAGPLVGRQLRYLVDSDHGWLGALGFAASALQLRDRDEWIGWNTETRRTHLHRVVGLSRFLIRPGVSCRNLASQILGMALKRLPIDFEVHYGFRPCLVETFVEPPYAGTCFKAANWQWIGQTQGRGRQDRDRRREESIKTIYVYVLEPAFREAMGITASCHEPLPALALGEGLDGSDWSHKEFEGAPLGDKRRTQRLIDSAGVLARQPGRAFCGVVDGDKAAIKGYYRLIDTPNDSAVTMAAILQPHRKRTLQRMKTQETVLCIQDGSSLNYSGLAQCEGLGNIGTNQTGVQSRGLQLHSTLAVTTEGLPLGVLRAEATAPEPCSKPDARRSTAIAIEQKRTFSWIKGLRDCQEVADRLPNTRLISVMDREADFFELFDEQHRTPSVDLLVRAKFNRGLIEGVKLFDAVSATAVRERFRIQVPRRSACPKKGKQEARPARRQRMAEVGLRYHRVELQPPLRMRDRKPITLWVMQVLEEQPSAEVEPLQWYLLSTVAIGSAQQAQECLVWYCLRWRIEDWHRVLKSGCRIEDLSHHTVERLRRAIAINLVIAWRIMLMTLLGREQPDLPPGLLFSDLELKVLGAVAKKKRMRPPDNLGDAVRLVAKLGGYLDRNNDPPPGHQLMWQGYAKLQMLCEGYELVAISEDDPFGVHLE